MRGICSTTATSFRSLATSSRMAVPCSLCVISRPRNWMTTFALFPSSMNRRVLRTLNS
ncbi:hypothetical protein LILAB_05920 [Corallococcus macrosporus]|uniref:Uncharacterized protein n=1 Tax=Myxococcus fulvus (strain ATCC BAA-855 / HW-1) TaxID=483219 RepID=F8C7A7_MYXFH|nr:hypothetical protein LILAB_05920 [Corallococcus macrosporus]